MCSRGADNPACAGCAPVLPWLSDMPAEPGCEGTEALRGGPLMEPPRVEPPRELAVRESGSGVREPYGGGMVAVVFRGGVGSRMEDEAGVGSRMEDAAGVGSRMEDVAGAGSRMAGAATLLPVPGEVTVTGIVVGCEETTVGGRTVVVTGNGRATEFVTSCDVGVGVVTGKVVTTVGDPALTIGSMVRSGEECRTGCQSGRVSFTASRESNDRSDSTSLMEAFLSTSSFRASSASSDVNSAPLCSSLAIFSLVMD